MYPQVEPGAEILFDGRAELYEKGDSNWVFSYERPIQCAVLSLIGQRKLPLHHFRQVQPYFSHPQPSSRPSYTTDYTMPIGFVALKRVEVFSCWYGCTAQMNLYVSWTRKKEVFSDEDFFKEESALLQDDNCGGYLGGNLRLRESPTSLVGIRTSLNINQYHSNEISPEEEVLPWEHISKESIDDLIKKCDFELDDVYNSHSARRKRLKNWLRIISRGPA